MWVVFLIFFHASVAFELKVKLLIFISLYTVRGCKVKAETNLFNRK